MSNSMDRSEDTPRNTSALLKTASAGSVRLDWSTGTRTRKQDGASLRKKNIYLSNLLYRRRLYYTNPGLFQDEGEDADTVSFDSVLWKGERAVDRLLSTTLLEEPSESDSQVTKNNYKDFVRLMENEKEREQFEEFLREGLTGPSFYCWLVLERYRAKEEEEEVQERDASETKEMSQSLSTRREARLICEIFCEKGSCFYMPIGKNLHGVIDRILWTTPDHVNIGRRIFQGMQAKIMVEMERELLNLFLRTPPYKQFSRDRCIAVISHASLWEVLDHDDARSVLLAYLTSLGRNGYKDAPSDLVACWTKIQEFKTLNDQRSRQKHLGESIVRTFLDKNTSRKAVRVLFRYDVDTIVEEVRLGLKEFFRNGNNNDHDELDDRDCKTPEMFDRVQRAVYFELRDRYFSDFTRSTSYIKCLSFLTGAPVHSLVAAMEHIGRPFSETVCTIGSSPVGVGDSLNLEEKNGLPSFFLFPNKLRRSAKIALEPSTPGEDIDSHMNTYATPREWRYAHRGAENTLALGISNMKKHKASNDNTKLQQQHSRNGDGNTKRIILGLEGVLRNKELRKLFATFYRDQCYTNQGAELLLTYLYDFHSLQEFESLSNDQDATRLLEVMQSTYFSKTSLMLNFLPTSLIQACDDIITKHLFEECDAFEIESQILSNLQQVNVAVTNLLIRKYFVMFRFIKKLNTMYPNLFFQKND